MKKTTLTAFLLLTSLFPVFGQIANGSVAPNFTATDINGNSHTLQTYLSQGKTVILNISATWCGPCWNYSQSKALSDIYYAYGPLGSDEVVILYVEGDASTGLNELNGISGNTVGDWVSNSPYPIIDSATIASQYQISYYPTVYRICPDGFVYEAGQLTNNGWVSNINSNCSGTLQGVPNHASVNINDITVCENGVASDVTFTVKNYGNNNLSSINVDLLSEGTITNVSQSLNLNMFQEQDITSNIVVGDSNTNSATLIDINNGNTPFNSSLSVDTFNVDFANATSDNNLIVEVTTDYYPSEITWAILDENGATLTSGGPYQPGTANQWGGGGPDANTIKTSSFSISTSTNSQCFSVEIYDSYGDGWSAYNSSLPTAGIRILDSSNSELFTSGGVGNFGNSQAFDNAMRFNNSLSTSEDNFTFFSIYPNPAKDFLNFNSINTLKIDLTDINGRNVISTEVTPNGKIDISGLNTGVYFINATDGNNSKVEKLIIN